MSNTLYETALLEAQSKQPRFIGNHRVSEDFTVLSLHIHRSSDESETKD
jgi:hypothetical protein